MYIRRTMSELLTECKEPWVYKDRTHGQHWDLGMGTEEAMRKATTGDTSIVKGYTDICNKVQANTHIDTEFRWEANVTGSRVSVPDYLNASPTCMRRRAKKEHTVRQVSIYVCVTCSAGIPADDMFLRGQCIVALVSSLQAMRISVDLYLVNEGDDQWRHKEAHSFGGERYGFSAPKEIVDQCEESRGNTTLIVKLGTSPLDLSVSGFAIAHPAFSRQVMYKYTTPFGWSGSWSTQASGLGAETKAYADDMRKRLGLQASDVFIPAVYYSEIQELRNPEEWVKKRLTQVLEGGKS